MGLHDVEWWIFNYEIFVDDPKVHTNSIFAPALQGRRNADGAEVYKSGEGGKITGCAVQLYRIPFHPT